MTDDPFTPARAALARGHQADALRLAWKAVMPAVLDQDDEVLTDGVHLGEQIALGADGDLLENARQFSDYCTACILEPRAKQPSPWSFKTMFARKKEERRPCPECGESIPLGARVCRFCGYRLAPAPSD